MSHYLVAPPDTLDWSFPLHAVALRHVLRHTAPARQASLAAALVAVDPTRATAAGGVMDACAQVADADAAATTAPEDGGRIAAAAVLCAATQPQLHALHGWALQVGTGAVVALHATPHDPLCIMSDMRRIGATQPMLQAASGPLSSTVARLVRCCMCIASLHRRPSTAERLREALSDASHLRSIELDHAAVCDDAVAAIVNTVGARLRVLRLPNAPRLTDAAFAVIGSGTQLATLVICGTRVTDKGLTQLGTHDGVSTRLVESLEALDLGVVGPRVTNKGTEALQRLHKLRSLRMRLHNGAAEVAAPPLLDATPTRLPSPAAPANIEMTPVDTTSTTSGLSTPALSSATSSMWSFTSITPTAALLLLSDHRHEPHFSASACAACFGFDSPPLVSIDFSGSGASVGAATLRALTHHLRVHTSLRDLRLANTAVTDAMVAALVDAGAARLLRTLDLSRTQVTDEGLALYIGACSKDRLEIACPLETLVLRELVISAKGLAQIGHAVGLQRLVLDGCPLVGTAALECISQCTALTALSLLSCGAASRNAQGGEEFTSAGFLSIARACTQLRSVSVADTGVNDMMVSHLAALPKLQALSVAHNASINGACFITFAGHPALVAVDLAGCEYFDAVGVHHLAAVGGLRHLDLVSAKLMSDEALAQLMEGNTRLERLRLTLHSCLTDAGLRNIITYGPALQQVEMYPAPEENNGDIMSALIMASTSRLDRKLITTLRLSGVRVFYDNSWTE